MSTKRQAQIRAHKEGVEFIDNTLDAPTKKSSDSHYVKNSILREELKKCKEQDMLTNEAVNMFTQIATKLSAGIKYNDPEDRKDCIAYAVLDCVRYWRNFDPDVSENAFAYITSICRNGFAKGWRALGKMKCPDSLVISLSDNLYSL